MNKSHIRLNKTTREWVIYSPNRGKRPHDFQEENIVKDKAKTHSPECPFCTGNEENLGEIILERQNPESTDWQIRVIPNKFPALTPDENTHRKLEGIYLTMPGYGRHEVIIENSDHSKDIPTMSIAEVEMIIDTYHQRYIELMEIDESMMVIIFRNHGKKAGASLVHPHSQIIATSIVPQHRRWQEEEAQRYYDDLGRCIYCDILAFEQQNKQRVIEENSSFLAFIPFAAKVPFEIWIMPKKHQADFGSISESEKSDFALILKNILTRLSEKLNDPDYNYVINTAARYKAEEPQVHWYCQIEPRLTTPAGFEIASGIRINPSLPELDAEFLTTT
ncbi:galactose-1-phosphate uridylyltransferase [Dapis sp. BLCC M126]|uniref:galactose-1-phosphate uridylyltransferase n=1 Tax=Dapis sp. BLCC M126 TaxID=3400189 RepID=UPI003CEAE995